MLTINGDISVGEGTLVRYVAFLSHPRYAGKETVNCKSNAEGQEWYDIHMDLARRNGEPACRTVTAGIIPHYRPNVWAVEFLRMVEEHGLPVRITGQLFFDASHRPCKSDADAINPKRATIWEIHPVYNIEVCKNSTLQACSAENDDRWLPLAQWIDTVAETD